MSPQAQAPTVSAEYDRTADALYIRLRNGDVARSVEVDDARIVDVDDNGEPIGVEILYPIENLAIASIARDFGFDALLAAIDEAVQQELGPVTQSLPFAGITFAPTDYRYLTGALLETAAATSSGTATASNIATLVLEND
jgi:uncharacterized protein YuzE